MFTSFSGATQPSSLLAEYAGAALGTLEALDGGSIELEGLAVPGESMWKEFVLKERRICTRAAQSAFYSLCGVGESVTVFETDPEARNEWETGPPPYGVAGRRPSFFLSPPSPAWALSPHRRFQDYSPSYIIFLFNRRYEDSMSAHYATRTTVRSGSLSLAGDAKMGGCHTATEF